MNKTPIPVLDTNILIRYLTNDTPAQALIVETLLKTSPDKSLHIPDAIIIEIVSVLLSFYELSKSDIIEKIASLILLKSCRIDTTLFKKTLELYANNPISFVDAYVLSYSALDEKRILYTFDKKLLGILAGKARVPSIKKF